jgi:predicted permease
MLYQLRAAVVRLREVFRRSHIAAEQDEEFRFHLDMEIAHNARRGMSEPDARRAALLRFGGTQRFREETADARGVVAIDNLARDARLGFRRVHRSPGYAAGVVATLGIGIGAAVGIGSIVYGVLLRDLPYANPDELVRVSLVTDGIAAPGDLHSEASYIHLASGARTLAGTGAFYTNDGITITDGDQPERVTAAMMTPGAFTILGVVPLLGALFETSDTAWTGDRIPVLISQELWERRYGGDSSIIGRRISINRGARVVIGVLPQSFDFPSPAVRIWYPASMSTEHASLNDRYLTVIGRLRRGATPSEAAAELNGLLPSLSERFPAITPELIRRSEARVTVQSLKAATVASVRPHLVLLGVLVAVVLLIATTNVVNLFLLRTERASQEIAIALSLGASRLALARRFVIEGMVLGLASVVVAMPVAALALATKFGFTEREIPRLHEVAFGPGTIALVLACALALGAAVGATALTRTGMAGLFDRLRNTRATASRGWKRAQNALVTLQIATALALLVSAGLLGRSFWNLRNAELGFESAGATSFEVSLPWNGYASYGESVAFHARVMDALNALPGVRGSVAALQLPLGERRTGMGIPLQVVGGAGEERPAVSAEANMASSEYFRVMGIPLLSGRSFAPGDVNAAAQAVVISRRLSRSLFGAADPVGRHIRRPEIGGRKEAVFHVVGVVGDVHGTRIEDGPVSMVYFPILRDGDGMPQDSRPLPYVPRGAQYVFRVDQSPAPRTIQRLVTAIDPRVPAVDIRPLDALVDSATARVRLTMLLIAVAGGAALVLGVIGVYSVVSYAAAGRVREFGIRLALGAAPSRVRSMVLRDGLALVAGGTVAGLIAAVSVTRFLRSLLYEVTPTSVAEFALATALLVVVTLLATLLPARRAARTSPAVVLRGE